MADFHRMYPVRFEDCDLAGIVFYPRYILMLHRFFEDWCAEGLGFSLGKMRREFYLGFPIIKLQTNFAKPSSFEDTLCWSLYVHRLGIKSATLDIEVRGKEEVRLTIRITVVCADLDPGALLSRPIPASIAEKMRAYLR